MIEDKRGKGWSGDDMLQCRGKEGTEIACWRIKEGRDVAVMICTRLE